MRRALHIALNFILGAGLWFLGFRMLYAGERKDRLLGRVVIAAGTLLLTSGWMMIAEWAR